MLDSLDDTISSSEDDMLSLFADELETIVSKGAKCGIFSVGIWYKNDISSLIGIPKADEILIELLDIFSDEFINTMLIYNKAILAYIYSIFF